MSLLDTLTALGDKIQRRYHYVNQGGCCIVAAAIANHLSDIVPTRIVVLDRFDYDIKDIKQNNNNKKLSINEYCRNRVFFNHVVVEFDYDGKQWTVDSTGVYITNQYYDVNRYGDPHYGFTVNEAYHLANQSDWNPIFDRDQIPGIRQMIGKHLSKYKSTVDLPVAA